MDPITLGLAGVGLASSIFGGYKAGQERKKMKGELRAMEADNKAFYNSQALGDYTQRADSQNVLRQMRNQLDRQTKRAANTQAITGGTVEQTAVQKDSANRALADATANIGAIGAQFKDRVTDRYINRKNQLGMMRMNLADGAAKGWENFQQTGLNTAAGALSSIGTPQSKDLGGDPGKIGNVSTLATTPAPKNLSGIVSNKFNTSFNR